MHACLHACMHVCVSLKKCTWRYKQTMFLFLWFNEQWGRSVSWSLNCEVFVYMFTTWPAQASAEIWAFTGGPRSTVESSKATIHFHCLQKRPLDDALTPTHPTHWFTMIYSIYFLISDQWLESMENKKEKRKTTPPPPPLPMKVIIFHNSQDVKRNPCWTPVSTSPLSNTNSFHHCLPVFHLLIQGIHLLQATQWSTWVSVLSLNHLNLCDAMIKTRSTRDSDWLRNCPTTRFCQDTTFCVCVCMCALAVSMWSCKKDTRQYVDAW